MPLDLDAPVDWKAILLDLRGWGWGAQRVGDEIGAAKSTVMDWCNKGKMPGFETGRALLKLHAREAERRESVQQPGASDVQPPPHGETMSKGPKNVRQPGEEPGASDVQPAGQSDPDAAIAAAQAGQARKIAKPRAPVAPSKVKGDPDRPKSAAVNATKEMSYAEAMKLREAGKLTRNVLTEQGWVVRNETEAEKRNALRPFAGGV